MGKIRDVIADMRYSGSRFTRINYWFIRVAVIAIPVLIILVIAGVVYAKMKGIEIVLPF